MDFIKKFIGFDKMIATSVIKGLYYIFLVLTLISGLVMMFKMSFFKGLLMLIIGPILVRLYAELIIVLFSIHDNLVKIRLKLDRRD